MFYERLETLCSQRGITVLEACMYAGLHRATAYTWKHGVVPLKSTACKLAKVLDTTVEYLLYGLEQQVKVSHNRDYALAILHEMVTLSSDQCETLLSVAKKLNSERDIGRAP